MDVARKLSLLFVQILFGLGKKLVQDQHTVQRRSELMGHVGQEFGFVLGGQRELFGLFLQGPAGAFDFLVLAFDFEILFGEKVGLFFQFLVGLLQLLLL